MVKGVNKTIIEVNNLNSKIFTKAIFFVNPKCDELSEKRLKREAMRISDTFYNSADYNAIPVRLKTRKKTGIMLIAGGIVLLCAAIITYCLLIYK